MKPKFTICKLGAQAKVANVDTIITYADLSKICNKLTGKTQFEVKWVNERIKEYIIKGYTMDDERLKNLVGGKYFL